MVDLRDTWRHRCGSRTQLPKYVLHELIFFFDVCVCVLCVVVVGRRCQLVASICSQTVKGVPTATIAASIFNFDVQRSPRPSASVCGIYLFFHSAFL